MEALTAIDSKRRSIKMPLSYVCMRTGWSMGKASNIFNLKRSPTLDEMWQIMKLLSIPQEEMAAYFPDPKGKRK